MPEGLARPPRALAWYIGLPFFYLRVPPNVTSVLSLLVNLFGGWLVIRGQATAGALVFVLSCLLDSVDGVTARLHVRGSRFGTLLDHYLDYLYYAILIVATGLGSYLPDQSARPLVFTGVSALSTVAAGLALEWYRRVYGFESNQAFNKRVNVLIVDKPSFKRWAGVLHLFKRHTFPYLYLLIALFGLEDLSLLAPAILLLVPFVTRHMFHSLEKQGLLPPARWPW